MIPTLLQRLSGLRPTASLMLAAFGAYFCMYAFRKPISVVELTGQGFGGFRIELKTALMIGQLVGYTASKFVGIVLCSAIKREHRAGALIACVAFAQLTLVGFAVAPGGWRVLAMFLNGLPLGLVWGLVVRYVEGRRSSDLLLAALSASFVVASGAVKDTGRWLLTLGVAEVWMPAATAALYMVPFVACVAWLQRAPLATRADEEDRVRRQAMTGSERRRFLARFWAGLTPLLVIYAGLTALRDFRDNYGIEMFREMGYLDVPALFSRTELPASLSVLVALGVLVLVRSHRRALVLMYLMMGGGCITIVASSLAYHAGTISGLTWMILIGVGTYLSYVPLSSVFFDRLTAAGGAPGTAVFGIYIADSLGYSASGGVQLYRDLWASPGTRLDFFQDLTWTVGLSGLVLITVSGFALVRSLHTSRPAA